MAKKIKPAQVEDPAKNEHVHVEVKVDNAPVENIKYDATAPIEGFDPKLNLRTVTNGVWRYICKDVDAVNASVFSSPLAKDFGIRENDMIFLVANKKHRIVVV